MEGSKWYNLKLMPSWLLLERIVLGNAQTKLKLWFFAELPISYNQYIESKELVRAIDTSSFALSSVKDVKDSSTPSSEME